jgi:hypothetical protein
VYGMNSGTKMQRGDVGKQGCDEVSSHPFILIVVKLTTDL